MRWCWWSCTIARSCLLVWLWIYSCVTSACVDFLLLIKKNTVLMLQSLFLNSYNSIFFLLYLFSLCNMIMLNYLSLFNTTLLYTSFCHMCESVHVQNVVISRKKRGIWCVLSFLLSLQFLCSADYTAFSWVRFFSLFLIKMSTEKICRHQLYTYVYFLFLFICGDSTLAYISFIYSLTHFIFLRKA